MCNKSEFIRGCEGKRQDSETSMVEQEKRKRKTVQKKSLVLFAIYFKMVNSTMFYFDSMRCAKDNLEL
jgi:hypothetical protein